MATYNKVIMMGNLTRDPQLSYLPSQTPVAEFGLATNRRWRSQDGTDRDETCFVDCRVYGRQAETVSKYCKKGRPLLIEGRLTFDQWETPEGAKRSKHRITVENFTFVGSRDGASAAAAGPAAAEQPGAAAGAGEAQQTNEAPPPPPNDDIPF